VEPVRGESPKGWEERLGGERKGAQKWPCKEKKRKTPIGEEVGKAKENQVRGGGPTKPHERVMRGSNAEEASEKKKKKRDKTKKGTELGISPTDEKKTEVCWERGG